MGGCRPDGPRVHWRSLNPSLDPGSGGVDVGVSSGGGGCTGMVRSRDEAGAGRNGPRLTVEGWDVGRHWNVLP